ncbi:MAG: hypothetical protein KDA58_08175, partial [Planctomycetaceae bacterium]|nr:hypothetical protein [Planctomycetaceae bacterium]
MTSHRELLVAGLQSPAAYPHDVRSVQVRETHISWVFLTGEFAYKVKKPVQTPFLDFHTLEQREAMCHEEFRLNRRHASDLYLDVPPITGSCSAPQLNGTGEPIEYALQMRQFPEKALLSRMAEAGNLRPDHVDELAQVVGRMHATTTALPLDAPWGRADTIVREAHDNLAALNAAACPAVLQQTDQLTRWTATAAERLHRVFEQR